MFGKAVYLFVFVVSIIIVTNAVPGYNHRSERSANRSHNLIVGHRLSGDRLVLRQNVVKPSSWWKVIKIQKTFNVSQHERITLVKALDQKTNGSGAIAKVAKGGPGSSSVTITFKSQRGHGINFVVELYARH